MLGTHSSVNDIEISNITMLLPLKICSKTLITLEVKLADFKIIIYFCLTACHKSHKHYVQYGNWLSCNLTVLLIHNWLYLCVQWRI